VPEEFVAARVIGMRVRVDDCCDRLVRQCPDLVEDSLAPTGEFRIDDDHAGVSHWSRNLSAVELGNITMVQVTVEHDFLTGKSISVRGSLSSRHEYGYCDPSPKIPRHHPLKEHHFRHLLRALIRGTE